MAGNGTPKVTVTVTNGNLGRPVNIADGVPGIVGTSDTKIGVVEKVYSLVDAEAKGYTLIDEPFLHQQIESFYKELGGTGLLYILGVEETMSIDNIVTATNANGLKYLAQKSKGQITHYMVCFKPGAAYVQGDRFLLNGVENAIIQSKPLMQSLQEINRPARLFIDGVVVNVDGEYNAPNTYENPYAAVVIGGEKNDGYSAAAVALARAVKYPCHVKIGAGPNGPTTLSSVFIGDKAIEEFFPDELDTLSDDGFILLHERDGLAGYYFGVDNMCSQDDYKILVHGTVVDKAHRIAVSVLVRDLETTVRIEADGSINPVDAFNTEENIRLAILSKMQGQISGIDVHIPTDQNIIDSSTQGVELSIQPLGYKTWIKVVIGLTTTL